jgi:hypothetical protein
VAAPSAGSRLRTVGAVEEVADFWDAHTARWLDGDDELRSPLDRWFAGYAGRGTGAVDREAFAEPYCGDLRGSPRLVILGLNPGDASLEFQGRHGIFADQIRRLGSYSAWAARHPYLGDAWTRGKGPNRFWRARLKFARTWLQDPDLEAQDLLGLELYPWHSKGVTSAMRPPDDVLGAFVWRPLAELPVTDIFAFGAEWSRALQRLGMTPIDHLGRGGRTWGSSVPSRTVLVYAAPSKQRLIVAWHSGSAGPPRSDETERLRDALSATPSTDPAPITTPPTAGRSDGTAPPPRDPLSELERLVKLREAGALTDEEFHQARARYVQQLTQSD